MPPSGFSWVDPPHLAALAFPDSAEDVHWLRRNGVEVLVSLSETATPRQWVNDAGLMLVHVPVPDMEAPTERQFLTILDAIQRANQSGLGVAVHCAAGKGRTGTVLAAYLVQQGLTARAAIEKVRTLRPGSIETSDQVYAIESFERRRATGHNAN